MSTGPKPKPDGSKTGKQREHTTQRGGARPNSGPKPVFSLIDDELVKLFKTLKREAKERGETWQENFCKHLYSEDRVEAAAFHKMLGAMVTVKRSQSSVEVTEHKAPALFLPEERADPAKVVPIKAVS